MLAGYVAAVALVVAFHGGYDVLLGSDAPPGVVAGILALGFGFLAAAVGGWVTAGLAPRAPMKHAY